MSVGLVTKRQPAKAAPGGSVPKRQKVEQRSSSQTWKFLPHPHNKYTPLIVKVLENDTNVKGVVFKGPANQHTVNAVKALQDNKNVKFVVFSGPYERYTGDSVAALQDNKNVKFVGFRGPYAQRITDIGLALMTNYHLDNALYAVTVLQYNPNVRNVAFSGPYNEDLITAFVKDVQHNKYLEKVRFNDVPDEMDKTIDRFKQNVQNSELSLIFK